MNMIDLRPRRPRIAVLLDENTSGDGRRYELGKGCFEGVVAAGGSAFGVPYARAMVAEVVAGFDGLLSPGGRFAVPLEWYGDGAAPAAPPTDRFAVERALMAGFLAAGKPVLGLCAGMQVLAGLQGCRLAALRSGPLSDIDHDGPDAIHPVTLAPGSRLAELVGAPRLMVNSLHRECVAALAPTVRAAAHAPDGVIEAVELVDHRFALGVQWHQELFSGVAHPGNRIFEGFVAACAGQVSTKARSRT